jgi:hypothetical protein
MTRLLSLLLLIATATRAANEDAQWVSIIDLIAHPEQFHHKVVRVSGFLHNQFEDTALYLSKEAADYVDSRLGIWIVVADKIEAHPNKPGTYFDCKRVTITGTFDKDRHGHSFTFPGTLMDVSEIWEEKPDFDGKKRLRD